MWVVFISSMLCLAVIPVLERLAPTVGLVDRPTERKQHVGNVPMVGGIAIFISLVAAFFMLGIYVVPPVLIALSLIIVVLGTIDDVQTLSARFRLLAQILVSLALVLFGDIRIESIGGIFGSEAVRFDGATSVVFTVMCAVGVINAINMIDGLDALSGSILFLSFTALALLAVGAGLHDQASFLFCVSGCLFAFLAYNNRIFRPKARIFLGDAGSMMLGLMLVWYFVDLSQGGAMALSAVSAGWIFGLPLIETVSVMVGRIVEKRSPFDAGRDHMHHRLRRAGFSVNGTVFIMVSMHTLLVLIGVFFASTSHADGLLFWGFVVLTVSHFAVSRYLLEPYGAKVVVALNKRGTLASGV
ncbi:MAG: MraY family glycosyltransferase [Granulosicoccus sp.]